MVGDKFTFNKREYAAIWAGGDGSMDLDLFVVDMTVTYRLDQRPGDSCWVEFVLEATEYQALIINWGAKANKFSPCSTNRRKGQVQVKVQARAAQSAPKA